MLRLIIPLTFCFCSALHGQAPGVPIYDQSNHGLDAEDTALGKQLDKLVEADALLSKESVIELLKKPVARKVAPAAAASNEFTPVEIAELAQRRVFRIGWSYLCENCDHWHFNLGGGYPVSEDGVLVTCSHVIEIAAIPEKVKRAALIAVDGEGKVYPVTGILANHVEMDAAVVTINTKTVPFSLNDQVRPGDPIYCFSRPMEQGKYFTAGIVNRFFWGRTPKGEDHNSLRNLTHLLVNVSCEWAPGSSGSAVLDRFGNVVGHVALIEGLGEDDASGGFKDAPMITLHTAVPARSVLALIRSLK